MSTDKRVALVTGGSRGIGRAVCLRLARMGMRVGVNFVSRPEAAEETLRLVREAGAEGFLAPFNVAETVAVQEQVRAILEREGRIDVLVNNAGITRDGLMARMSESDWDAVLTTNLKSAFLCSKAVMRAMMKQKWGRIINISSVVACSGNAGQVNYSAAKAGLIGLSKSMARELASRGVTVNCIAPGFIATDMTAVLPDEVQAALRAQIPAGELGSPDDVAAAAAFLASDDSRYITGQTLHVNGGMYMC